MASSLAPGDNMSVGYVQELIKVKCDICDTEEDVTSHCTECVKNLCTKCKQYHDKFLTDHKIITVFEGRIIRNVITKCQTHDLVFSYYCDNCLMNFCNKCLMETHRKCTFVDVDKHAQIFKMTLTKRVHKQRKYLPEIGKVSDSINDHMTKFDKIIDSQITLVEIETEKRHKELDINKSDLIKQFKYQQSSAQKKLKNHIQTLQDLRTSIDNITRSIETQINLVPNAGVLHLVNESNAKLDSTSINTTFEVPNPPMFTPSTLWDQGNNLLGSLQYADNTLFTIDTCVQPGGTFNDLPEPKFPSPVLNELYLTPSDPSLSMRHNISVIRELSMDHYINSCTPDGSTCWVGCLEPHKVQLYDQRGKKLLSVELSHDTDFTALTTTGELLVSGDNTTIISRVNKSGEVRTFTNISALGVGCVLGLVTTRQGDVFVCVRMTGKTKDKVLTFSAQGKNISELNSHFFISTNLLGIHTLSRDTFCVLDGSCRLVIVEGRGQLVRHIDRSTTELQKDIRAVAGDRHGHLFIVTGEYIHVLSGEGTCKRTYHIQGSGWVRCISVGEDDVLWAGTSNTGNLVVAKYLV